MVSTSDRYDKPEKLGEKSLEVCSNGDQQQLEQFKDAREFARIALERDRLKSYYSMLGYSTVLRMVEVMRHHNPECYNTVRSYLVDIKEACSILDQTPDGLVVMVQNYDEKDFEELCMRLDNNWLRELNAPGTRIRKWASLRKFLVANRAYNVRSFTPDIERTSKFHDIAPSKDDCRRALDAARTNREKLVISLLIESLQRIGTISKLMWGDMLPHLEKNEDTFLVWIEGKRTKCSVPHFMPIGRLSSYHLKKRFLELQEKGFQVSAEMPLFSLNSNPLKAVKRESLMIMVMRILNRAMVRGTKQSDGKTNRYDVHVHAFRKFGVVEMENKGVNEQVIRFLMGQKRDTYSKWSSRPKELLEIYRSMMPSIESKDVISEVIEFAKSKGLTIDPNALIKIVECGKLGAG